MGKKLLLNINRDFGIYTSSWRLRNIQAGNSYVTYKKENKNQFPRMESKLNTIIQKSLGHNKNDHKR